jgi:hypothetical protein
VSRNKAKKIKIASPTCNSDLIAGSYRMANQVVLAGRSQLVMKDPGNIRHWGFLKRKDSVVAPGVSEDWGVQA